MGTVDKEPHTEGRLAGARQRAGEIKAKAEAVAVRERDRRKSVRAAFRLIERDRRLGGSLLAGGLAYRIFLFALPYGLFISSLARVLGAETTSDLVNTAGLSSEITSTVDSAAGTAGRAAPVLLVIGFVLMLWTAQNTWKALCITSELAWGIRRPRAGHTLRIALIMTASIIGLSVYHFLLRPLFAGGFTFDVIAGLIAAVGLSVLATWGATSLPRPDEVPWIFLVPGSVLFGFGIEALRFVTTFFLSGKLERTEDLYGALGVGAVIMGFLYLVGRLISAGIFANAEWWRTHIDEPTIEPEAEPR